MKVLQLTAILALSVVLAGAFTIKNEKSEETRELIRLLEKVLKRVSPDTNETTTTNTTDVSPPVELDPFEEIIIYLHEDEKDIVDEQVYKIGEERLKNLLRKVVSILGDHIDDEMQDVVSLRLMIDFVEYIGYDSMGKIWRLFDAISKQALEENDLLDEVSNDVTPTTNTATDTSGSRRRRSIRELKVNYEKVIERSERAMALKQNLNKRLYVADSQNTTDLPPKTNETIIHPNLTIFDAIFLHLIQPFDSGIWDLHFYLWDNSFFYWENVFGNLKFLAERGGLLQFDVYTASLHFASEVGNLMYTPPAYPLTAGVLNNATEMVDRLATLLINFDGTTAPEVKDLSDADKAIFAQVYLAVTPLVNKAGKVLKQITDGIFGGEKRKVERRLSGFIAKLFSKQLSLLSNIAQNLREKLPQKTDALDVIKEAAENGRSLDVLVDILAEFTELSLATGADFNELLNVYGGMLDRVAANLDEATNGN